MQEKREVVDTLRLLTKSQDIISAQDIHSMWMTSSGMPVEVVEFLWSQNLILSEADDLDHEVYPVLAAALVGFCLDSSQWESFLRSLLRKNVGLHSSGSRLGRYTESEQLSDPMFPFNVSGYGTPLDELFMMTWSPYDGEASAHRWLQILSSEGYDVVAYLEEELMLHAQQMQLTRPSMCWWCKCYCFQFSEELFVTDTLICFWA